MPTYATQKALGRVAEALSLAEERGDFSKARGLILDLLSDPEVMAVQSLDLSLRNELARSYIASWSEVSRADSLQLATELAVGLARSSARVQVTADFRELVDLTIARVSLLRDEFSAGEEIFDVEMSARALREVRGRPEAELLGIRRLFIGYAARGLRGEKTDASELVEAARRLSNRDFVQHLFSRPVQAGAQVALVARASVERCRESTWCDQAALTDGFTAWAACMQSYSLRFEPSFVNPTELAALFVDMFCGACIAARRQPIGMPTAELAAIAQESAKASREAGGLEGSVRSLRESLATSRSARVTLIGSMAERKASPEATLLEDYLRRLENWLRVRPANAGVWERLAYRSLVALGEDR